MTAKASAPVPAEHITHSILLLRSQKVLLDSELAALYGVPTKALNQAVKRNSERFPEDFLFRLTPPETEALNRSHFVTSSQKHRDPRFPPYAFTEHGAIMAATILNSPRADVILWTCEDERATHGQLLHRCRSLATQRVVPVGVAQVQHHPIGMHAEYGIQVAHLVVREFAPAVPIQRTARDIDAATAPPRAFSP